MKKRRAMEILLTAGMLAATLTACGGASKYNGADTAAPMAYEAVLNDVAYDDAAYEYDGGNYMLSTGMTAEEAEYEYEIDDIGEGAVEAPQDALAGRKLIKNVYLNVETERFDVLEPNLERRVAALGGYIEDMSSYSRGNNYSSDYVGTKYLRHADMTVRMPKENLDTFLDEVGEQTNIVSRSENVTDVTLQYVDLESHKKALTTEQNRLLELMEKAETVEDIITIEGRLSEVRYQIESMESQLRTYDNKIDYSTVYLSIDEVERYTPTEEFTTGERIRTGFMDSVKGVGRGISNFAIRFVINLPYLIVWAVIIVIIVLIVRTVIKGMKKRRAKKAAKRVDFYLAQNPDPQGVSPERQPDEAARDTTPEKKEDSGRR